LGFFYVYLIFSAGDGDSNTFSMVADTYGIGKVRKIECCVHLRRVFLRKVKGLHEKRAFPMQFR